MKKLLVIDGNSILNRAFYGIRELTNSAGLHTNAVYGMINMLTKYISDVSPDYAAVAFDMRAPTFRHLEYEGYKANRHGMPEELAEQLPYAKRACKALGLTVLEKEGYEADDILGTLSSAATVEGVHSYIVTGDRDSLQLITDSATVLLATNTDYVTYDGKAFFEKYGITPDCFVDVKALMGDSSDNIPGVAGIGEKTALSLIREFKGLENIYEGYETASLTPSVKRKLSEGRENAFLSRRLAKIVCDVPLGVTLSDLPFDGMNREEMFSLCRELEFGAFIKRFELEESTNKISVNEYTEVETVLMDEKTSGKRYAVTLDTENGICRVATEDGDNLEVSVSDWRDIAFLFEDENRRTVCCDCKNLYSFLADKGIKYSNCAFDIMLAAYVISSGEGNYSYPRILLSTLGEVSEDENSPRHIYEIFKAQSDKLAMSGQEELYYNIELPFAFVLADMEIEGFAVDKEGLREYSLELEAMEREYTERIYFEAGCEFNINSPKQLGEVLFERLGLPAGKKTKSGYSTGAEVLEKLRPYSEVVSDVLDYRKVAKLRGTYGDGLLKVIEDDGCIHTVFKQTGTATGRISSAEPNLQNIPVRTELGRKLRKYFIPRSDDRVLIDADYSQIELRLLAHISGDETMISAFRDGVDIHTVTASEVFGIPKEMVTGEMRKRAKAVNFGIVYGIGAFSLAQDLGITKKQADEYIKGYLATYPKVNEYLRNTIESAKENGYTTTLFGRRRYIPELAAKNKVTYSFGERVAMNSPIQGSAADIIKIAMIRVVESLKRESLDATLILQVHDEIIIESSEKDAPRAAELLREAMEGAAELSVPLDIEILIGKNWLDSK
ncbi:MAG: DNA polymerase I [Clostridia bacterium]|nr:DNA polymerase I [Clostridia bacterium]